jgi:hypothetical protein
MVLTTFTLKTDYWESITLGDDDIEHIYAHLLELETPLSLDDLVGVFVKNRLAQEQIAAEKKQSEGGQPYLPKNEYAVGDRVVFPTQDWATGEVINVRDALDYSDRDFKVIGVKLDNGEEREFASELEDHVLNIPPEVADDDPLLNPMLVRENFGDVIGEKLKEALEDHDDFVYIAGKWFPRALLVDVNVGNLNLAEAVLDMNGGGPLPTSEIIDQVDLPEGVNKNLAEFSLDLAMQEDKRFDEVGSAGQVAWFLKRMEPEDVLQTPIYLRQNQLDYSPEELTEQMLALETQIDDELSLHDGQPVERLDTASLSLIYPHWRAGTLPLSRKLAQFFPTAYESPRVRFMLVDGTTGEKFPGWVVRLEKYVYGLREWFLEKGVMPGSKIFLRKGKNPGEVIVDTEPHRSAKEWVRTALIGADGGVVYAMLKQPVATSYDDWMMIALPGDTVALDNAWEERVKSPLPFEQVVVDTLRELAKLNPQSHVHAAELYSAVNVIYRCPPGPIMALLSSRSWFSHVGDLHFRYNDSANG